MVLLLVYAVLLGVPLCVAPVFSRILFHAPIASKQAESRDVVFMYGDRVGRGLLLAIKSLRVNRCQARLVQFTGDRRPVFPAGFVEDCRVEVMRDYGNPYDKPLVPHMVRFNFEAQWLRNHTGEVDRVLHTDSFDVVFQGDPFAGLIPSASLLFALEPHAIRSCGWNLAWFTEVYGEEVKNRFQMDLIICSGTISGSAQMYLKLVELMVGQREWEEHYGPSNDQPILNYLVWSGRVEEEGIAYGFAGCDSGFMTVQWCVINHTPLYDTDDNILSPVGEVPVYVHQYTRIKSLEKLLYSKYGV